MAHLMYVTAALVTCRISQLPFSHVLCHSCLCHMSCVTAALFTCPMSQLPLSHVICHSSLVTSHTQKMLFKS